MLSFRHRCGQRRQAKTHNVENLMDQTLQDFLGIQWPARSKKPRAEGITMVMDTGWPTTFCESMMAQYGEYLDVVKLWDPHLRAPEKEIRKKIEVYNHYNVKVQPGGIFMEIARIQGCEKQVMEKMADLGFSVIEVSSTATTAARDMQREMDFVKYAKDLDFTVFGEVGKKFIEGDTTRRSEKVVDEEVTVKEMLALLNAGASYVYWEGHLLRRVMGETAEDLLASRDAGTQQVLRVAKEVGQARIIFEVSPLRPMVSRRTLRRSRRATPSRARSCKAIASYGSSCFGSSQFGVLWKTVSRFTRGAMAGTI